MADAINIHWSIWDASPTVRWVINGTEVAVTFNMPPLGANVLPMRRQIVVATTPGDGGTNELRFFSYTGSIEATVSSDATKFPRCMFAFARELPTGEIEADFSYDGAPWGCDQAGILDVETGVISKVHPIR